jgi:hypothetical protein
MVSERWVFVVVFVLLCVGGRRLIVVTKRRESPTWGWQALCWFVVVVMSLWFLVTGQGSF